MLLALLLAATPATGGRYEVRVAPDASQLSVSVWLAEACAHFHLEPAAAPFVDDLEGFDGHAWKALAPDDAGWASQAPVQQLRYRYRLSAAAWKIDDRDTAFIAGETVVAPPSTWLVRPNSRSAPFALRVVPAGKLEFVTGLFTGPTPGTWWFDANFDGGPYSAFGRFTRWRREVSGGSYEVALAGAPPANLELVKTWVWRNADAVAAYFHGLPVPTVELIILPQPTGGVRSASAMGFGGAAILVRLGDDATEDDFAKDWILPHELVHLGFPNVSHQHTWLVEGLATYVEPLARVRKHLQEPQSIWRWLMWGIPQGQPDRFDHGLDRTHTWGRTYWGGAGFCLLADLEIRKRTHNTQSLDTALRAIVAQGGSLAADWDLEQALAIGDKATGVPVLAGLFRKMANTPVTVPLEQIWKDLGVKKVDDELFYDDTAPLADVRKAITLPEAASR